MRKSSLPLANPKGFAKWLVECRTAAGLTQMNLSEDSGIATRTIVALENAKLPRVKTGVLLRLGHALDIQPEATATAAGPGHEEIIRTWIESGGIIRDLRPSKRTWDNWDDRVLTKEDLQFLMDMHEQFDSFTLKFALDLLSRRKP